MRKKWIRERQKQVQAGILAILCFCMAVLPLFDMTSVVGRAATFSGPNIWSGGSEMLFGHKRN